MNELLETKWNELYPDDELSDWEKEGAGYQHGLDDGRVEGRVEGLAEGMRLALFDILHLRGFTLDTATRERIEQCSDLEQLDQWRQRAMKLDHLEWLLTEPQP